MNVEISRRNAKVAREFRCQMIHCSAISGLHLTQRINNVTDLTTRPQSVRTSARVATAREMWLKARVEDAREIDCQSGRLSVRNTVRQ
jgi:hypothetical protein